MASGLLQIYHRLPAWTRSWVASAHGYRLRSSRFGTVTPALVQAAHAREHWTAAEWSAWQDEQLRGMLEHAARAVPHYRRFWDSAAGRSAGRDPRKLSDWPILEKADLRANPASFLAEGEDAKRLTTIHTSGSTGTPLTLWRSRSTDIHWYALFEARARLWYGVSRESRWANIGGRIVVPVESRRPPFWVWNLGLNQLYMSSYHLKPDAIPGYIEALRRYRIDYLLGYSSSLDALAEGVLRSGMSAEALSLGIRVAITNAEPIYPYQRERIHAAFGCPVRETYGMAEIATAACECEAGALHEWPDAGVLELLEGDRPVAAGETGDVVATCLLNAEMPLIRYRVGDRATRMVERAPCECGRTLPRLAGIEGRIDDVIVTREGRPVGRMDPIFKGELPLIEAQIVQESLDRIVVRYVPGPGFTSRHADVIRAGVRERVGDVEVALEEVSEIPRGANGKFRAVVSKIKNAPPPNRSA